MLTCHWSQQNDQLLLHVPGEMMVGAKQVQFMDEISTGLDSSTTYSIVKFLRDQAHALNYTTLISLLQPAPESYDLFDDVLLLAEGETPVECPLSPAINAQSTVFPAGSGPRPELHHPQFPLAVCA